MTFKEKFICEHPDCNIDRVIKVSCPCCHGYEDKPAIEHCKMPCIDCWNRTIPEMKIPKIEELIGKVIETRNGYRYLVVGNKDNVFGTRDLGYVMISGQYTDDLKSHYNSSFDINKVLSARTFNLSDCIANSEHIIWERKETKEMTVSDVEKLVGCKVKIVGQTE